MTKRIAIPKSQRGDISVLLETSPSSLAALTKSLGSVVPKLANDDIADQLDSLALGIPESKLDSILNLITVWYAVRMDMSLSPAEMVEELIDAADRSEDKAVSDGLRNLRTLLIEILSLEMPLGVISKARFIGNRVFRAMFEARIISDARPIFLDNPDVDPAGFVITHTLLVTAGERPNEHKDWHFSLDLADLRALGVTVERAIKKHEALRSFFKSTKAAALD